MDMFSLEAQVAVVTGASRGIGQSIAVGLAEAGADIVAVSSSGEMTETQSMIQQAGRKCVAVKADVGKHVSADTIVNEAIKHFGKVSILVNCAGITRRCNSLDFPEKDWDEVMDLNAKAAFFLGQACARDMVKRNQGKIINIASMLSFQGGVLCPSYTASKHAIVGITKAQANEWASLGINVNAIAPGYIDTNLTRGLKADLSREPAITSRIPQGRWGLPDDLKGAVVFLASSASNYVQGHVLCVDGGWMSR